MPMHLRRALSGAVPLWLALVGCRDSAPTSATSAIPLTPCHLTGTQAEVVDAECGTLPVWENRATKVGRKIDLHIAVVRATGRTPAADALFFLAGGPGQSALGVFPSAYDSFKRMNLARDVVLVDQRGTGASNGLPCPNADPDEATDEPAAKAAALGKCRAGLQADLTQYTTAVAMDDLDDVRAALGYPTIDLYGGSYGTRAALVYLRRHEEHVRAVVLDGVAPPGWILGRSAGRDGQRSIDLLFARCAADVACHEAFPALPDDLAALLAARTAPVDVVVPHPTSAVPTHVKVSRATLASTLQAMSYESEMGALLPLLVHAAASTGDLRPLAAQSLMLEDMAKIDQGMHFAVACSEDAPFLDRADVEAVNAHTYLGAAPGLNYLTLCEGWPRANVPPEDRAPVRSNVPVLLLSGEVDPITPPSNAEEAARTLPHSLQITLAGEGHGAIARSCTRRIVGDFIEHGTTSDLSTDCLKEAKPMRFFTTFAGPQP